MVSNFSLLFRLLQGVVGLLIIPFIIGIRSRMVLGKEGGSLGYYLASQFLAPLAVVLISILFLDAKIPDNITTVVLVLQLIILIIHEYHLVRRKKEIEGQKRKMEEMRKRQEEEKRKREAIIAKWME